MHKRLVFETHITQHTAYETSIIVFIGDDLVYY